MDVTLEPAGFYDGTTRRYYFMEGADYENGQVEWTDFQASIPSGDTMFHELATDEQIDAVLNKVGYKRLYQFTYDPATAKRYQTLNGNATAPGSAFFGPPLSFFARQIIEPRHGHSLREAGQSLSSFSG